MYAIAFDLVVADTERYHPKGVPQAYADIGSILADRGFSRVQGSLYVTNNEDMANLFMAVQELRARPSRPLEVREPEAVYAAQWRSRANETSSPFGVVP